MSSRRLRVEILTEDLGIFPPEATGLEIPIQAARVSVGADGKSTLHAVAWAAAARWELPEDASLITGLFPGHLVSCTRSNAEGSTALSCPAIDRDVLFSAAAAAAVIKRSWSWDESPAIEVNFRAQGVTFLVNPVFEDKTWLVEREGGA
jgi:hypothetical protein